MARRKSRQERLRKEARRRFFSAVSLIATVVLMLGGGGFGLHQYMQIEQMGADFCYVRADQHTTAIFLDTSVHHNMDGAQFRDLETALERSFDEAPPNARIMIFTTARNVSGSLATPVYSACRPAETAAEQAALGAPSKTTPNLQHIAGEARAAFNARVQELLADARSKTNTAMESPILSQVQAISRYPGFQGRNRSFVWFSDGIENSETAQFCAVRGDMPSARKFVQRPNYAFVKPDSFAGVDVTLLLLESIKLPQAGLEFCTHAEMRSFWESLFELNGADNVLLQRLRRVTGS